jgi:hypothetical protein
VVVGNGDVERIPVLEPETDTPLVVDANAVLARSVAPELLKPVGWGEPQVSKAYSRVELRQAHGSTSEYGWREHRSSAQAEHLLQGLVNGAQVCCVQCAAWPRVTNAMVNWSGLQAIRDRSFGEAVNG